MSLPRFLSRRSGGQRLTLLKLTAVILIV